MQSKEHVADAQREIERAEANVKRLVTSLRGGLDWVEVALADGTRVSSALSGEPLIASTARDLSSAIVARQTAYDRAVLVQRLVKDLDLEASLQVTAAELGIEL